MAPRRAPLGHRSPRTVLCLPVHQRTQPRARFWGGGRGSHRSLGRLQQGHVQGPQVGAALWGFGSLLAGAQHFPLYLAFCVTSAAPRAARPQPGLRAPRRAAFTPSSASQLAKPCSQPIWVPIQPDSGTGERSCSGPCPCSGLPQSPGGGRAKSSVAGSAP